MLKYKIKSKDLVNKAINRKEFAVLFTNKVDL